MTPQDIERIAREAGEIAFADGKYTLQKGDVIMSPDALAAYTARVFEEAAELCQSKHANGNHKYDTREECASAILDIAASLGGKDGG